MDWTALDFVVATALVASVFIIYTLAVRKTENTAYRAAVGIALAAAFFLVWVNGAVGIIGDENNDANMMYAGVLAVAIAGAIIARFQPHGMARALYASAIAQALVPAVTLFAGLSPVRLILSWDVLFLTVFLAALWIVSARLFHRAARSQP